MSSTVIVLRYFPVLGRAQALRHALTDARVSFEDLRVPVAEWPARRTELTFAGPHRSLPTLSWGQAMVAETLPIATFLAGRLGHHEGLDDEAVASREAIVSSCYLDVMSRFIDVIRADLLHPGADPARSLLQALPRLMQKFELLDARLPETSYVGGNQPVLPDLFVGEALEVVRYVLGTDRDASVRERLPRSWMLADRLRTRAELAPAWDSRPARFTARADEDVVIARLQSTDLSAAGF